MKITKQTFCNKKLIEYFYSINNRKILTGYPWLSYSCVFKTYPRLGDEFKMKFVISKNTLTDMITNIQNVVAQKPTIPILSNFLIEAANDELVLTATDLTVGMRCYTEAKILEEGAITLPARKLFQLTRELTTSNVEMSSQDGEVSELIAGTSHFKIHGMNKNEFPTLPDLNGAKKIEINQKILKDMLFRTSFAVSREDNRYVLTGVLCQIHDGQATFVGTDGKRLAEASTPIATSFSGQYIIPLKAVEEIYKNLEDTNTAKIFILDEKIAMEINRVTIVSKLLSGDYPDFKRIIPEQTEINLDLHREELISLLRQVSLFTGEANQSVRFIFDKGQLILTANHVNIGEGRVSMPVNYQGPNIQIAFSPIFFLDILRHSKDETVKLGLSDPYNPGIITDTSDARFVIMPMRLSED